MNFECIIAHTETDRFEKVTSQIDQNYLKQNLCRNDVLKLHECLVSTPNIIND